LKALNTPYLNLYLIHDPYGFEEGTEELLPMDENNLMRCSEVDFVETWIEMEKLVKDGLVRSIGISNFNAAQTERILDICTIKPVTNQVECHPYLNNEKLRQFSALKEITLTAYAPLGSPGKPWPSPDQANLLTDDVIVAMSARH
jgi:aldehyde reductase